MEWKVTRREFVIAGAAAAAAGLGWSPDGAEAQVPPGERSHQEESVEILHPRGRVPLSFIIDDSTCLVNPAHFCMPQFAEVYPNRADYKKPWRTWPREIPDSFLREFGQWCAGHGVRGKFSIVPYPGCVGWLDRELPGWSRRELQESLKLVRQLMVPSWDIHPEMITHTRVIDLRTGRPLAEVSPATMENSYPRTRKSVDELASYIAYALRILKNCELPCEGITTPGGFGNLVKSELSMAVQEALRDVYGCELPHYFKYVSAGKESTRPRLEHVAGLGTGDPRVTVNIPAGTDDWFGGWDGDGRSQGHKYASPDATGGRMVELIQRGEPAIMLCHWPGLYNHGTKEGFRDFQGVVTALERRFRHRTIWMKLSEIARYWAARELTRIEGKGSRWTLTSPFASPRFTLRVPGTKGAPPKLLKGGEPIPLRQVDQLENLDSGTWLWQGEKAILCFDLPKGEVVLQL